MMSLFFCCVFSEFSASVSLLIPSHQRRRAAARSRLFGGLCRFCFTATPSYLSTLVIAASFSRRSSSCRQGHSLVLFNSDTLRVQLLMESSGVLPHPQWSVQDVKLSASLCSWPQRNGIVATRCTILFQWLLNSLAEQIGNDSLSCKE